LPLSISQFLSTILVTVDRIVVASMLGVAALGIYAFAVALSAAGAALGMTVRTIVFPDLFRQARADDGGTTAATHVDRTVVPFAWLLAPLLGLFALAIGPALAWVLPAFADAAGPARVFVFTGVAQGLVTLGMLGLVAAERQRSLPLITLVAALVNIVLSITALTFGLGLVGLAAAALVCRLGYALSILILASGAHSIRSAARLALQVILPVGSFALLVWLLANALVLTQPGEFGLAMLIYLAATAPVLLLVLARRSGAARPTT
ncbi:MAG: hypothetical protein R3349_06485, partial [Geminicoccaceae bacterium]|nr:hypothetical protein [Geminicoccaceae bacterium]